jgi:hypothetical protein
MGNIVGPGRLFSELYEKLEFSRKQNQEQEEAMTAPRSTKNVVRQQEQRFFKSRYRVSIEDKCFPE